MARSFRGHGRGSLPAPKRQIANDSLEAEIDGATTVVGTTKAAYSFGLGLTSPAATLVRTRGQLIVRVVTPAAGENMVRGAFGMIVVSSDAFAIGVTALPGPLSDSGNDWFLWVPFALAFASTLTNHNSQYVAQINFDSRGMRKLKIGETLAPVLEFVSDVAGSTIDSCFSLRLQVKL